MWWFKALLFFLLSPGILLTIPAGSRGIWMSGQTSVAAAAVHALVFVVAMYLLWPYARRFEGFTDKKAKKPVVK